MKMENILFVIVLFGLVLDCLLNLSATTDLVRISSFIAGVVSAVYLTVNVGLRYSK